MVTKKRRTIDEQIAATEAHLKALKAARREKNKTKKDLTRDSEGMQQLIDLLTTVAKANKVKKPVLLKALAKVTRSGLKFAE